LQSNVRPKFTALQNLEKLFTHYPVTTTQTSKLRFDKVINFAPPPASDLESPASKSMLFSHLMTSVNPFAKFIINEMIERPSYTVSEQDQKHWELDVTIFGPQA